MFFYPIGRNLKVKHAKHFTNFYNSLIYIVDTDFNILDLAPAKGYPLNPKTIGEHIRKKRMDLGLMQKEVAGIIGVTKSTIWNWENGWNIQKKYMQKVEGFLGDGKNEGGTQNSNL